MPYSQDETALNSYVDIGTPSRIWTVPSIHSDVWQLIRVHDHILSEFRAGDRIVYLGNYIGIGDAPLETLDEILTFRRMVMSIPGVKADDLVYLRGLQEEMWQKLLQIHFAPNPYQILGYLLENGIETMIRALGSSPEEGLRATREGVLSLTRWTNSLREKIRRRPGLDCFFHQLKRAAYTSQHHSAPLLFVNSGIDPERPLHRQSDSFWWSGKNFNHINEPYAHFHKVVRGYDPNHEGLHLNCVTATLDDGCGYGGNLVSACVDAQLGEIRDIFRAQ